MKVLNRRNQTESGVYIGRPSRFGNPFIIGVDGDRDQVVARFEAWLRCQPELMEVVKKDLRGKNLVCWCALAACHGDVLLRIANEDQDGT